MLFLSVKRSTLIFLGIERSFFGKYFKTTINTSMFPETQIKIVKVFQWMKIGLF